MKESKLTISPAMLCSETLIPYKTVNYESVFSLEEIQDVRASHNPNADLIVVEKLVSDFRNQLLKFLDDQNTKRNEEYFESLE